MNNEPDPGWDEVSGNVSHWEITGKYPGAQCGAHPYICVMNPRARRSTHDTAYTPPLHPSCLVAVVTQEP